MRAKLFLLSVFVLAGCNEVKTPSYWYTVENEAKRCSDAAWVSHSDSEGNISIDGLKKMHWQRIACLLETGLFQDEEAAWCFFYSDGQYGSYLDCIDRKTYFLENSEDLKRSK